MGCIGKYICFDKNGDYGDSIYLHKDIDHEHRASFRLEENNDLSDLPDKLQDRENDKFYLMCLKHDDYKNHYLMIDNKKKNVEDRQLKFTIERKDKNNKNKRAILRL